MLFMMEGFSMTSFGIAFVINLFGFVMSGAQTDGALL